MNNHEFNEFGPLAAIAGIDFLIANDSNQDKATCRVRYEAPGEVFYGN